MTPRKPITNPPDAAALLRYVSGQSPLAEADWIRRWAAADPDREGSIAELRAAWEQGAGAAPAWDGAALWGRIEAEMGAGAGVPAQTSSRPPHGAIPLRHHIVRRERSIGRVVAYALAASVVLAAAGVTVLRTGQNRAHVTNAAPAMREVATARGEIATLSLADGSTVTLAPGSTLRAPVVFGPGPREAMLEGEAVFTVKHDAARPFLVRTRAGVTRDIGTRFVIRAYPDDSVEMVAVAEGAVALGTGKAAGTGQALPASSRTVTLRSGDLAHVSPGGAIRVHRGVAVADYFAWTARRLAFTETPMPDVVRVLDRWYDLDIQMDDTLAARALTADFSVESAPAMLGLLEIALGARVEQHGRHVMLHAR